MEGTCPLCQRQRWSLVQRRIRRRKLRLCLERRIAAGSAASISTEGSVGHEFAPMRSEPQPKRRGRPRRYPKEMRIRVVAGEIVNSPVAESDSAGTPVPGNSVKDLSVVDLISHASRGEGMEVDCEDSHVGSDSLKSTPAEDSGDLTSSFEQVPEKGKKRGVSLRALTALDHASCRSSRPRAWTKDAIEEVTGLFPQMSPKSVVAETLRVLDIAREAERWTQTMKSDLWRQIKVGVNVAKIAVQRLVEYILKCTEPTDEVKANNLALEREIIKLHREMDVLRRERMSLKDQRAGRIVANTTRLVLDDRPDSCAGKLRIGVVHDGGSVEPGGLESCDVTPYCKGLSSSSTDRGAPISIVSKISEKLSLGLVAISEPNCVPDNDRWLASNDSPPSAAITWQWSQSRVPCSPRWRGTRFVAMDWGEMIVVSCYFPPSLSDGKFSRDLYELENKLLGVTGCPVIITGDFNARAPA
ncbi:hypothetical protein ALC57_01273 [Trachymyrmex cornetzi]|uniref:Endonuclease/exonuclease/phosphatase domain-containing protein n=1 Tax=Trachymyrmex cornetzi TaxID=471704 RepID=A0A151JPY0_9HYME|nr:hypothetical protein ALC57_01273 [Trachymyrmex cornetzi]